MTWKKESRTRTTIRQYGWIFVFLVAFGGLWLPRLGLLLIPMMLGLAMMGFFRGKYWCGNYCPHGSLFDAIILPLARNSQRPDRLASRPVIWGAFAIFMVGLVSRLTPVISEWGTVGFWDRLGYVFVFNYLVVTLVGSILGLTINARSWCSICPMGTFQSITYRLGTVTGLNTKTDRKIRVINPDHCKRCGKCTRVCPMQLTPYDSGDDEDGFNDDRCIRCGLCAEQCPFGVLQLDDTDNRPDEYVDQAG